MQELGELMHQSGMFERRPDGTFRVNPPRLCQPKYTFKQLMTNLSSIRTDMAESSFIKDIIFQGGGEYLTNYAGTRLEELGFHKFNMLGQGGFSLALTAEHQTNGVTDGNFVIKLRCGEKNPDIDENPVGLPFVVPPIYSETIKGTAAGNKKYGPIQFTIEPMALSLQPKLIKSAGRFRKVIDTLNELIALSVNTYNTRYEEAYGINPMLYVDDISSNENIALMPYSPDRTSPPIALPVVIDSGHIRAKGDKNTIEMMNRSHIRGEFTVSKETLSAENNAKPDKSLLKSPFPNIPWYDEKAGMANILKGVRVPKELQDKTISPKRAKITDPNTQDELLDLMREQNGKWGQAPSRERTGS